MFVEKIKITKFKSIYDTLELNFRDLEGVWKIGGVVGAGKTTIGEAIMFALFGTITGKSNSSLISWGENHSELEIWCISKGHNIHIIRTINKYGQSPMTAYVDGEEIIYTNKRDAQTQLETDYYDISRRPLELLCIMSFNNFKSLATLNPSETRKFLDQILGFYILTKYMDICNDFRRNNDSEILNVNLSIANNNAQIQKIKDISNQTRIDGDISITKEEIKKMKAEINTHIEKMNIDINDIKSEIHSLDKELATVKALGMNKKKEIDFILKGVCPTCGAPIDQSQLEIKQQEKQVLADRYVALNKKIAELNDELKKWTANHREILEHKKELLKEKETFLTILNEQERRAKVDVTEIDKLDELGRRLQENLNHHMKDHDDWMSLSDILSNKIRSIVLSGFIPSLNKNILKYTTQLGQKYVVEFNNDFNCSIKICGLPDQIPISSLSTGQMKTLDMCIIMGMLGTVLNSISFNITFLDELISNMDSELRCVMCQMFRSNIKPGHTTFVLSHTDIERKYFDGIITAELRYIDDIRQKSIYTIEKCEEVS